MSGGYGVSSTAEEEGRGSEQGAVVGVRGEGLSENTCERGQGTSPVMTWAERLPSRKRWSKVPETQLCCRSGEKGSPADAGRAGGARPGQEREAGAVGWGDCKHK